MSERYALWRDLDINIEDIPTMRESINDTLISDYYKMLADNRMNPDDYYPKTEFRTEGDSIIISITPIPIQRIGGICIKRARFED